MSFYIACASDYEYRNADALFVHELGHMNLKVFSTFTLYDGKEKTKHTLPFSGRKLYFYQTEKENRIEAAEAYYRKALQLSRFVTHLEIALISETASEVKQELGIALPLIHRYLLSHEADIGLLTHKRELLTLFENEFRHYDVYICKNQKENNPFVPEKIFFCTSFNEKKREIPICRVEGVPTGQKERLADEFLKTFPLEEDFKHKLIRYMNKSKKTNVEIYTRGGITRQVFSKIVSYPDYLPKKPTIICLIIGMELCLDDALDLLNAVGYTLSRSIKGDFIIYSFIQNKQFDLDAINEELDKNNEPVLGWKPRED